MKNYKAIPWLLAWSLIYTLSVSFAKELDPEINNFTIVFFRSLFGFLFLIPALARKNFFKRVKLKAPLLMAGRAVFMMLSMWATYYAYRSLDLSIATTIGFTQSFIMTTLAAFILGEKVTLKRWALILIGYGGVLFFTKASGQWALHPSIFIALGANLFASLAIIFTKKLTETEDPLIIVAFPLFFIIVVSAIGNSYIGWHIPSSTTLLKISLIAAGLTFTQYAYVRALANCEASFAAPFEYLRLIVAIPIGCLYFCEILTINKVIGALIIITSNFYLLRSNKS